MHYVKGIELTIQEEPQHTALIDCDLLAKVYINLIDQKNQHLIFRGKTQKLIK
jgi:DNA polymerase-3 subunit epsilon